MQSQFCKLALKLLLKFYQIHVLHRQPEMSKPLLIIAFWATVILAIATLPANGAVKGLLTTAGGSICDLREKSPSGSTVRRLRLSCQCQNKLGNNVGYQCFYKSDMSTCCKKSPLDSTNLYHSYEPAYYGQAAEQIKGKQKYLQ